MNTGSVGGADCRPNEQHIGRGRTEREALQDALRGATAAQKALILWRIRRLNARLAQHQALQETFCLAAVKRQH